MIVHEVLGGVLFLHLFSVLQHSLPGPVVTWLNAVLFQKFHVIQVTHAVDSHRKADQVIVLGPVYFRKIHVESAHIDLIRQAVHIHEQFALGGEVADPLVVYGNDVRLRSSAQLGLKLLIKGVERPVFPLDGDVGVLFHVHVHHLQGGFVAGIGPPPGKADGHLLIGGGFRGLLLVLCGLCRGPGIRGICGLSPGRRFRFPASPGRTGRQAHGHGGRNQKRSCPFHIFSHLIPLPVCFCGDRHILMPAGCDSRWPR